VTVTAQNPLVSVSSSTVGQVVDTGIIESLPLNGRQFANLAAIVPGVGIGFHVDPTKGVNYAPLINGGAGRNINYQIDGGDNNDDTVGGLLQQFPLEAIDVPEMAQRNVAQLFEQQARGLAMLAFDDIGGLLTFTSSGELYMSRRTEITAAQLTEVQGEEREQTLDRLVLELQRSLDHFDRQFSYVGVSRLLVAPLAVDLGLERHLADNLGLPVEMLDLTQVLEFAGAPELRDPSRQGYRLHIIGAALRQELAA